MKLNIKQNMIIFNALVCLSQSLPSQRREATGMSELGDADEAIMNLVDQFEKELPTTVIEYFEATFPKHSFGPNLDLDLHITGPIGRECVAAIDLTAKFLKAMQDTVGLNEDLILTLVGITRAICQVKLREFGK